MKKIIFALPAILMFLTLGPGHAAWADSAPPGYYDASDQASLLAPEELDDLLAPIALYPDPLIAQILPAATFVDQIDEAARYVRQFGRSARIDAQAWDVSVKAVAHYPEVLFMMDQKYDWTVALGQAFIDQQQDVMDAIQRLRADAQEQGNLFSTQQQQVIDDPDGISIVPAAPEYLYVPVYDPQEVYVEGYNPAYPFITFGGGLAIGAWLSRDLDWNRRRVYYHGWRGGGWISRSRPHINDKGNVYINKSAAVINLNKRVLQHDTRRFRQELKTDAVRQREERAPMPLRLNQPAPGRIEGQRSPGGGQQRPTASVRQPRPATSQQKPVTTTRPVLRTPTVGDVFRGRDVQRAQPVSNTGYGGYGNRQDATTYHQRGQASQESMRQSTRPAPVQRPAAAAGSAPSAPKFASPQPATPGREKR